MIADVPAVEPPVDDNYLIKRDENTLITKRISEEKPQSGESPPISPSMSRTSYIVIEIFIALPVLFAGIFAFRKVSKKV